MKTSLLVLLSLSLTSHAALGQAHIIKQRAKELNQQNNARQGVTPAAPNTPGNPPRPGPAAPAPAAPAPAVASPAALRQYDVMRMKADFSALKPGTVISATQTEQLARNIVAAARGAAKPSPKIANQLARNLGSALAQSNLPSTSRAKLAEDLVSILNCEGIPAAKTQATIETMHATLQGGGVNRTLAGDVATDLKSMAGELQKASAK